MYQIGRARVRIHGEVNRDSLMEATERFVRSVDYEKRKKSHTQSAQADGATETKSKRLACG